MNKSIKFLFIFTLMILPSIAFAQTGKIFGKVVDAQTGEPLIGANVLILGTNYGAATDVKGEFIILNILPGTYNISARYIGYREQINQNIKVYVNLTTEVNFNLQTEEYTTDVIVVQAPKPLINKNITNSTDVKKSEDIENLPIRGVNAIVSTSAGVVNQGGNIYVRGSRSDAVAFYVDGVLVNDPLFGGSRSGVINNAIEEIQVQAGGYSAEFGGANGGIISTQTRTGRDNYQITAEVITDNIAGGVGNKFLDTYSYGYSEYAVTIGGPVIPGYKDLKFFLAGNNIFRRSRAAFDRGINMKNVVDPSRGALADTIDIYYPNGYLVANPASSYQVQGNLTFDLNPITLRVNANFVRNWSRSGVGITTYAARRSATLNESQIISGSIKGTHVLAANAFYDVIVNYYSDLSFSMDPIFKHNIAAYGDSLENAKVGRNLQGDGFQLSRAFAYGYNFLKEDETRSGYEKRKYSTLGGKFNFLYQLGKNHEFKAGVEYTTHTIRRYALGSAFSVATLARSIADGSPYDVYNRVDNYGFDVYGNETDNGLEAPKKPVFAAVYVQDKMEYSDLVLNVGFRYDYINIDGEVFKNPNNIKFNENGEISQDALETLKPIDFVSPRIGVSFPVTDKTVFHAQYGKFIQQSRLRDVYQGYTVVADNIRGGFAISAPVGFGVRPERTTQYEIGFKQQLGESFAFDITGFYKDIKDQVQIRSIFADADATHKQYYAWVNGDFATTKGIELKLDLRRTERISATVDYTYSDAQGTGSNPSSAFRTIWQSPTGTPYFPQQVAPLDFNQAHKGNINIDYRFGKDDGPEIFGSKILSEFGANFLFSFASGFNFTRWEGFANARTPVEPLNNSTSPWTFQIDARIDKSFSIGPLSMNIYLWVQNLLNTQNVVAVFNNTGDAYDDGWLASDEGQAQLNGYKVYGQQYADTYKKLYKALSYSAGNFGAPRQIRLGVKINY